MQKQLLLRIEHPLLFPEVSNKTIKNYLNGMGRTIVLFLDSYFSSLLKKNAAIEVNWKDSSKRGDTTSNSMKQFFKSF